MLMVHMTFMNIFNEEGDGDELNSERDQTNAHSIELCIRNSMMVLNDWIGVSDLH